MGLLDNYFTNMSDPAQQGLLAAAASLLNSSGASRVPISMGQALGQGLMAGNQGYQEALKNQLALKKQQNELDFAKELQSAGNLNLLDSNRLGMLAQRAVALNHPGAVGLYDLANKRASAEEGARRLEAAKTIPDINNEGGYTPGRPGLFSSTPATQKLVDAGAFSSYDQAEKASQSEAARIQAQADRMALLQAGLQGKSDKKDKYSNVQADGNGGFVGLNNQTMRFEKIPVAEGVTSKIPNGGTMGGRNSVMTKRVLASAIMAKEDLNNITDLPITVSRGAFGGREQGPSLLQAAKEDLVNTMTTQEVQDYNVSVAGLVRNLATIESAGLMPSGTLVKQMDAVILKEGDTNFTKMRKLAQIKQIVNKGVEIHLSDPQVPDEMKDAIREIISNVNEAVPFSVSDINKLQNSKNPKATLGSLVGKGNADNIKEFNSEEDAKAANLPDGTPVIINGVKGTWRK